MYLERLIESTANPFVERKGQEEGDRLGLLTVDHGASNDRAGFVGRVEKQPVEHGYRRNTLGGGVCQYGGSSAVGSDEAVGEVEIVALFVQPARIEADAHFGQQGEKGLIANNIGASLGCTAQEIRCLQRMVLFRSIVSQHEAPGCSALEVALCNMGGETPFERCLIIRFRGMDQGLTHGKPGRMAPDVVTIVSTRAAIDLSSENGHKLDKVECSMRGEQPCRKVLQHAEIGSVLGLTALVTHLFGNDIIECPEPGGCLLQWQLGWRTGKHGFEFALVFELGVAFWGIDIRPDVGNEIGPGSIG